MIDLPRQFDMSGTPAERDARLHAHVCPVCKTKGAVHFDHLACLSTLLGDPCTWVSPRGYRLAVPPDFRPRNVGPMATASASSEVAPMIVKVALTVEMADKWYGLIMVTFDLNTATRRIEEIPFPGVDACHEIGCALTPHYVDHVPNPKVVRAYADFHDYELPALVEELLWGRWVLEVLDGNVERSR